MPVWLASKTGYPFLLRDGFTKTDPVFIVAHDPVFFKTKRPSGFKTDAQLEVVADLKPLADAPYKKQVKEHRTRLDAQKASKAQKRAEEERSPAVRDSFAEDKDDDDGADLSGVKVDITKPREPRASGAAAR